jgi:hypothetical protein
MKKNKHSKKITITIRSENVYAHVRRLCQGPKESEPVPTRV